MSVILHFYFFYFFFKKSNKALEVELYCEYRVCVHEHPLAVTTVKIQHSFSYLTALLQELTL